VSALKFTGWRNQHRSAASEHRNIGLVEVGPIATGHRRAADSATTASPALAASARRPTPLAAISRQAWRDLAARAIEPNGYHLADWQMAVDAFAAGRTGADALASWDASARSPAAASLNGLLPVISCWRAFHLPLPALVSADPYGTLGSPLLDRDTATVAAARLLNAARDAGARALILRNVALEGKAFAAFTEAMARDALSPRILHAHARASLDARQDADKLLRDTLGPKKLKDLRRQRRRLAEQGAVSFAVARRPDDVRRMLEIFLTLEASGWKGRRGTALLNSPGDARFIRVAAPKLAETGECEIISLSAGATPIAAAIVLRHQDRAFYFKLGIDESFAKFSPGVQLTLDLTRHLCADPQIASADSTADAGHTMIEPIWPGRFRIGDVLLPLYRRDPAVALTHAALVTHAGLHRSARRLLRIMRGKPG